MPVIGRLSKYLKENHLRGGGGGVGAVGGDGGIFQAFKQSSTSSSGKGRHFLDLIS